MDGASMCTSSNKEACSMLLQGLSRLLQIFDVKNVALIKRVMMEMLMVTCDFVTKYKQLIVIVLL